MNNKIKYIRAALWVMILLPMFATPLFGNLSREFTTSHAQTRCKDSESSILNIPVSEIDSAEIYSLDRMGMESYERSGELYKLSDAEIKDLVEQLKDSTHFYGGTPMSFQFSSGITFYFRGKSNTIWFAPAAMKLLQQDFDIPYNRMQEQESLGGAVYFPFTSEKFTLFLQRLEDKYKLNPFIDYH